MFLPLVCTGGSEPQRARTHARSPPPHTHTLPLSARLSLSHSSARPFFVVSAGRRVSRSGSAARRRQLEPDLLPGCRTFPREASPGTDPGIAGFAGPVEGGPSARAEAARQSAGVRVSGRVLTLPTWTSVPGLLPSADARQLFAQLFAAKDRSAWCARAGH